MSLESIEPKIPMEIDEKTFEEEMMRTMQVKVTAVPASNEDKKWATEFLEVLPEIKDQFIRNRYEVVAWYLTLPTITDEIINNTVRYNFIEGKTFPPALRAFYQLNKLKRDNIHPLLSSLHILSTWKQLSKDENQKLKDLSETIKKYNDLMPKGDRLTFVEEVTQFCRDIVARRLNKLKY